MWVEPDVLKEGGDVSRTAGQIALSGADALGKAPVTSGIFGDFDQAHAYHSKLTAGHASHVRAMRGSYRTLTGVGDKANIAATDFATTEERNTSAVQNVSDG